MGLTRNLQWRCLLPASMMPRHSGKELHVLSRTVESISGGTSSMMKGLPHHSVSAPVVNPSTTLPATLRLGTPRLHPAPLLLPQLPRTALPQPPTDQARVALQ